MNSRRFIAPCPNADGETYHISRPERSGKTAQRAWLSMTGSLTYQRSRMSAVGPEAMGTAAKVWHRCRCAKTDGVPP